MENIKITDVGELEFNDSFSKRLVMVLTDIFKNELGDQIEEVAEVDFQLVFKPASREAQDSHFSALRGRCTSGVMKCKYDRETGVTVCKCV